MKGKILCVALLSAALILMPTPAKQDTSDINNIERKTANVEQARKSATQEIATLQEKTPEPPAVLSETAVKVQTLDKASEPEPQVTSTCADEVKKYDWNQNVAHAVMMAESRNKPDNHNDDPSTGDYSIGCFQINLLGSANLRAKYRDAVKAGYTGEMTVAGLEQWLKTAKNNVAVAHIMWQGQGWKPWGKTTCAVKVKCY